MASKNDTSLTPTGTPTVNQTKRLSTVKAPGSPKTLKTGGAGGVKDVVSPGELCGFVRSFSPSRVSVHPRLSSSCGKIAFSQIEMDCSGCWRRTWTDDRSTHCYHN